jgi:hypothetical protein
MQRRLNNLLRDSSGLAVELDWRHGDSAVAHIPRVNQKAFQFDVTSEPASVGVR